MKYLHRSVIGIFSSAPNHFCAEILPPQHAAVVGPADDHGPRAPVFKRRRMSAQDPFAEPRFADEQSAQLIGRDDQRSFRPLTEGRDFRGASLLDKFSIWG
jgi:hypothetical protein